MIQQPSNNWKLLGPAAVGLGLAIIAKQMSFRPFFDIPPVDQYPRPPVEEVLEIWAEESKKFLEVT